MDPEHLAVFSKLGRIDILALCIIGEARGEPIEGQIAVGCVVRNRVNAHTWYGEDYRGVVLKDQQFSCFNADDPNLNLLMKLSDRVNNGEWDQPIWIAGGIVFDFLKDNTKGATHYHEKRIKPRWITGMKLTAKIGNHIFYQEVL